MSLFASVFLLGIIGGYIWYKKFRPNSYMPELPSTLRTDISYGYYINDNTRTHEIVDHVNFIFEFNNLSIDFLIDNMKKYDHSTVLTITRECFGSFDSKTLNENLENDLTILFDTLKSYNLLQKVKVLYPIDEPDARHIDNDTMIQCVRRVKEVCKNYPELKDVKFACIYSTHMTYPGLEEFDIVGLDDYAAGSNVLINKEFKELLRRLNDNQRVILVPGGADPWRQDPEAFRRYAHSNPKVIAIVPFLWIEREEPIGKINLGIGKNPMKEKYIKLGKELLGK